MKSAYKHNTIRQVPATEGFGTLCEGMVGDNVPNLERKLPPDADAQRDYSNKLTDTSGWHVTLISHTVRADQVKRMRVRQGKAGPNGKKRPTLDMLAKAEPSYAFGKLDHLVKNDGFGKFGEREVVPDKNIIGAYDKHGKKIDPRTYKTINGKAWEYTQELKVVKKLRRVESTAFASENILNTTNDLLRQIMLFKGISFNDVERDVKLAGKPVSYVLNTMVCVDLVRRNDYYLMERRQVHKVTVKKTFREIENVMGEQQEVCKIFFDGKCCKPFTLWLNTLDFLPE